MTETATPAADAEVKAEVEEYGQASLFANLGETFESLLTGADVVKGHRLIKSEDKAAALVGTPFVITHVRFNPGKGTSGFMASIECVTQDSEPVVFNDGSTGVYRQVVAYLESKGLVELPDGPASGPAGESRFDAPLAQWRKPKRADEVGQERGFDVRLVCPRGLRTSEYEGPAGMATTYYLG
jgi:hypothetical protein